MNSLFRVAIVGAADGRASAPYEPTTDRKAEALHN